MSSPDDSPCKGPVHTYLSGRCIYCGNPKPPRELRPEPLGVIREAADRMRNLADAATKRDTDGTQLEWRFDTVNMDPGDYQHIEAWSPAVALAVSKWLDIQHHVSTTFGLSVDRHALAVSREFLRCDT